jgi:hypothetical protein
MMGRFHRLLVAGIWCGIAGFAHYTWVAPLVVPLQVGKTVTVQIGHGHKFPQSEEAINAQQLDLFVLAPSGAKVRLQPVASGPAVTAPFVVKEPGLYRIAFIQDRGISSRTPSGLKPGGRDRNPNATQAYRTLRTAVAYAATTKGSNVTGKPAGLEFELTGTLSNGVWSLQLLKQGRPAAGIPVEAFLNGAPKALEAGKTGPDGRLRFELPVGASGPAVFSAALKDNPPAGAAYDSLNYETSLYVTW